jgi:flagellar basal body-associated protein FliL
MPVEAEIFQVHKNRTADWRKVIGLLCLIAWVGMMPFPDLGLQTGMASENKGETGHGKTKEGGNTIKMIPLVVNLNEPGGRHYLKTTVILEIGKKEWVEEVQKQVPSIMDVMIMTLSDKTLAELQTPQSKDEIRKELLAKAQKTPAGSMIKHIYFDEFLFQ